MKRLASLMFKAGATIAGGGMLVVVGAIVLNNRPPPTVFATPLYIGLVLMVAAILIKMWNDFE